MVKNLKHFCVCATRKALTAEEQARLSHHRVALLTSAKWDKTDIRIRFLEGEAALKDRVRTAADEWTKIANLNFVFVESGKADVRIAFKPGDGSWSYLGTMCLDIDEPEPTMNYGWLDASTPDDELRRVVLHEFGHAIGLIHEHQNPKGGIEWNVPAVIADLKGPPNYWDDETISNNIFKKYPTGRVQATSVDPTSIMMYPIPKAWTVDGFSAALNSKISANDKQLVRTVYPGRL